MRNLKKPRKIQRPWVNTTLDPTAAMMHITIHTGTGIPGGIIPGGDSSSAITPRIFGDILFMIRFGGGGITTIIILIGTIRHMLIPMIYFRKEHSIVVLPTRDRLPIIGWSVESQVVSC
jgi:hypothetical protein